MNPSRENDLNMTRRQLFGRSALGLGTATMAQLLGSELLAQTPDSPEGLHHPAKAKRVIYLFMSGGPSQQDMWDYKPKMKEMFGKDLPEHIRDGQRITGMTAGQKNTPPLPFEVCLHQAGQQRPGSVGQRTSPAHRKSCQRTMCCSQHLH
jgi:hypothetical protein